MDLKDFIKETISAIVDATIELQSMHADKGAIVNPPLSHKERELYEHENTTHRFRRVEHVEFDVAVTAATETSGGGKPGLRILSAEAGVEGRHTRNSEEVSRVRFSLPVVLPPADIENRNKAASEEQLKVRREKSRSSRSSETPWIDLGRTR